MPPDSSGRADAVSEGAARPVSTRGDDSGSGAAAARTVEAIRAFLTSVDVPIAAERIGGAAPLEILFHTDSGRALVREAPLPVWRAHADRDARGGA